MTDNLGHRIEELESHTVRMTRLSSFKSTTSLSTNSSTCGRRGRKHRSTTTGEGSVFRSRWVQGAILALVSIMTLCLVAMATLYILQVITDADTNNAINLHLSVCAKRGGRLPTVALWQHLRACQLDNTTTNIVEHNKTTEQDDNYALDSEHNVKTCLDQNAEGDRWHHPAPHLLPNKQNSQDFSSHREAPRLQR